MKSFFSQIFLISFFSTFLLFLWRTFLVPRAGQEPCLAWGGAKDR